MFDWKTCSIRAYVGLYGCAALELQLQAWSAVEPAVVAATRRSAVLHLELAVVDAARSWMSDDCAVCRVAGAALADCTSFVLLEVAILLIGKSCIWLPHLPLVHTPRVSHLLD